MCELWASMPQPSTKKPKENVSRREYKGNGIRFVQLESRLNNNGQSENSAAIKLYQTNKNQSADYYMFV